MSELSYKDETASAYDRPSMSRRISSSSRPGRWCASWRSARLPPAILTEVPMRLIGFAVVPVAGLTVAPLTGNARPGRRET
jgi:hypothetical protein